MEMTCSVFENTICAQHDFRWIPQTTSVNCFDQGTPSLVHQPQVEYNLSKKKLDNKKRQFKVK